MRIYSYDWGLFQTSAISLRFRSVTFPERKTIGKCFVFSTIFPFMTKAAGEGQWSRVCLCVCVCLCACVCEKGNKSFIVKHHGGVGLKLDFLLDQINNIRLFRGFSFRSCYDKRRTQSSFAPRANRITDLSRNTLIIERNMTINYSDLISFGKKIWNMGWHSIRCIIIDSWKKHCFFFEWIQYHKLISQCVKIDGFFTLQCASSWYLEFHRGL